MGFWKKTFAIFLWAFILGTYLWLLSYIEEPPFEKWISVVGSTLIGGVGFAYLNNLYNIPYESFEFKHLGSAVTLILGLFLVVVGAILILMTGEDTNQIWVCVGGFFGLCGFMAYIVAPYY